MTYRSKVVSCGKLEIVVTEKEPYTTIKGGNNKKKIALRSHSRQSQTQRGGSAVHLVIGTASQLRDRLASENEGQFHPLGRLKTCGVLHAFPLRGGCKSLRPANRHRGMALARCGF